MRLGYADKFDVVTGAQIVDGKFDQDTGIMKADAVHKRFDNRHDEIKMSNSLRD